MMYDVTILGAGCGCGLWPPPMVHLRQLLGGMNAQPKQRMSHGALSSTTTTTTTTTAVAVVVVVLPLALGVVATSLRLLLWRARIISHSLEEDARYIWNEGSMVSRDK